MGELLGIVTLCAVTVIISVAVLGYFTLKKLRGDFVSIKHQMELISYTINKLDFSKLASNLTSLEPDAIRSAIHDAVLAELTEFREMVPETTTIEEKPEKVEVSENWQDQRANHLRTPISEKGKTEEEILEETLKKIGSLYNDAVRG